MEVIAEAVKKTKVIGTTFEGSLSLIPGGTYKEIKKNTTTKIVEHYYPFIIDRLIEVFTFSKYENYLDKNKYYWQYAYEKAEDDAHEKFEFKFALIDKLGKRAACATLTPISALFIRDSPARI